MEDYLEINYDPNHKKEEIKLVEHENLYDECFKETAKLWKNYSGSQKDLIKDTQFGRIFFKQGKPAYFEIFGDNRTELIGISKKISFLYTPLEKDNISYDKDNCIGFRYYENNKLEKCKYFTLIKKYDKKFYILEKEENIVDVNGDLFYDNILDCYSIMRNIVFEKYKNKKIIPTGEFFPEIFGFIYSLFYLGKFKGFKVIEPLVLEPLKVESRIENFNGELEENFGYIEPIIFDNHISVAFIKKSLVSNKRRVNIIFDMSRYHVEENILDNNVFPDELRLSYYPYPSFPIQKDNSCGIWFYGIIELIYSNDKYQKINDVCLAINRNSSKFFIDVINCLSSKIYGIEDIIDNSSLSESLDIKENRIYEIGILNCHSFKKEAVESYFFSLASIFPHYQSTRGNSINFNRHEIIFEYQYLIDNVKKYLSLVIFNDHYFKMYSPEEIYEKDQKKEYQMLIEKLKELLNDVSLNYEAEFNNTLYEQFEDNLKYGIFGDKKK